MDDAKKVKKKSPGKVFEDDFAKSFVADINLQRLKDAAGWGDKEEDGGAEGIAENRAKKADAEGGEQKGKKRFTINNPADFVLAIPGGMHYLELKSVAGESVPFGNLKQHQVMELAKLSGKRFTRCSFVFNFRRKQETYLIDARDIYREYTTSERKSFSREWCRKHGQHIPQTLLRTRFRYEVDNLTEA